MSSKSRELKRKREGLTTDAQAVFDAMEMGYEEVGLSTFTEEVYQNQNMGEDEDREYFKHFEVSLQHRHQLMIHKQIILHATAYLEMSQSNRRQLIELCETLQNDSTIDQQQISKMKRDIAKNVGKYLVFEKDREKHHNEVCYILGTQDIKEFAVGERKIFKHIMPHEVDRLCKVFMDNHGKVTHVFQFGHEFAVLQKCKDVTEYCAAFEYAVRCMLREVEKRRQNDKHTLKNTESRAHYIEAACENFMETENMEGLSNTFKDLQKRCKDLQHPFANPMAAANHYDKHKNFPTFKQSGHLDVDQYFDWAKRLTSGKVDGSTTVCRWTQDGSSLQCTFTSKTYEAFAVRYDKRNGSSVIATMHRWKERYTKQTEFLLNTS